MLEAFICQLKITMTWPCHTETSVIDFLKTKPGSDYLFISQDRCVCTMNSFNINSVHNNVRLMKIEIEDFHYICFLPYNINNGSRSGQGRQVICPYKKKHIHNIILLMSYKGSAI